MKVLHAVALVVVMMTGRIASGHDGTWTNPRPVHEVNTESRELNTCTSPNGLELYITTDLDGGTTDIWVYRRTSVREAFANGRNLGPLVNSSTVEGLGCLSADARTLYFFSLRSGSYDLYLTRRENIDSQWGAPEPITELNTEHFEGSPSVTADGLTMVFVSDRPGSLERDLWLAERSDEQAPWQVVRNITEISTVGRDTLGAISPDGRTVFWSPWDEFGTARIWCATRETPDGRFGPASPLGPEVNTSSAWVGVPGLSWDWPTEGATLYWVGCDLSCDIYAATWQVPVRFLRGDSNADGVVDVSDPSYLLNWLFLGGPSLPCEAAGDPDGDSDGDLNISDASYLFNYLFLGGPEPFEPFPECGPLPEDEALPCETPPEACR